MATSEHNERTHSLIRFVGFGGIAALLAAAVAIGKTQAVIESDSAMLKEDQHQTEQVIEEVKVEQQELTDVARRVDKLEDKVNAR
ncbi:hypothetical protein [Lelliottia nimipressuralis]|uniref:YtxH domain-containing protein n=1 Tax=Lelliottia nimipressuralis TaxID=69220 RepID=A0ABD4KFP7_9ENTR|nr:hypothetical protein [Lelliottia nimipressuralis]MBF4180595.1 hypothetical protein [Lelliottia nimipressuralis]